ncbi:MAG: hypothetical protein K8Q88_03015 [Nitrosarchaeum sp.]|nr:hypothetical protein [Nitrosarchaeum sp.]
MLELSDLLQIDATIIAGILILLTISSYKVSESDSKKFFMGFTKEGMTALVVTPFAGSAIISLFRCIPVPLNWNTPITNCSLVTGDLILPIAGFFYLILVVYLITRHSRVKA